MTPEGLIKNQICQWLALKRCFFWIQQAGKIPGRINKSRFLRNGTADILGIWHGKMLAIEVKTQTGTISKEQAAFLDAVNINGGIGFVARSLDEVIKKLERINGQTIREPQKSSQRDGDHSASIRNGHHEDEI